MTKSIIELAREAHLFDDDQEPLVQHLELFAALHRAAILEELTGEMPEPVGAVYTLSGVSHCTITKALDDIDLYTADQMREYAAGLVLKERQKWHKYLLDNFGMEAE
jgi:DNA-binding transcriptional ArsR family regulator